MKINRLFTAALMVAPMLVAQDSADKITLNFSDPSRPGTVKLNSAMHANISVKVHASKEVLVEASGAGRRARRAAPEGMRRIGENAWDLKANEAGNVITLNPGMTGGSIALTVPPKTNLILHTMNGSITVDQAEGEVEVNTMNGAVTLNQMSGPVVAHSMNGKIKTTFARVDAAKPMSFSSMNGTIDVTFPQDLKATMRLQNSMGDIFTDFDVVVKNEPAKVTTAAAEKNGGKYKVHMEKAMTAIVNGGGAEIQVKTFNGTVYLRKQK